MGYRRVYVKLEVMLTLDMDEGQEVSNYIQEMDYEFKSMEGVDVHDTQIRDYEVEDSK